jgi:threonylcarbamoyladenosine tRNA methylthiotransferase CDKAL1
LPCSKTRYENRGAAIFTLWPIPGEREAFAGGFSDEQPRRRPQSIPFQGRGIARQITSSIAVCARIFIRPKVQDRNRVAAMDDIEDLLPDVRDTSLSSSIVAPKALSRNKNKCNETCDDKTVPGTQTLYMKTYGCSHNVSDGEYMQGILAAYGYKFTDKKEDADLWYVRRLLLFAHDASSSRLFQGDQ